jgi:hypothetical protein
MSRKHFAILALAVLLGVGAYLVAAALTYRLGFPLDDSWIHVTYARNLAMFGQWAFRLGHPSAGSTSPLWTLLLTPGVWLGLGPLWWSYVLGALELFSLSVLSEMTVRRLVPAYRPALPWTGLFIAFEWHLLWAAVSGMETLLQAALATLVLALVITGSRRYLALGILTGLSAWVRPDGLTLAGPSLLVILVVERSARAKGHGLLMYLIGVGALFLPYLVLNLRLSGTPLPNTFYAKQAEYVAWQGRPLLYQLGALILQLLTGPSLLLLPGVLVWLVRTVRLRDVRTATAMLWCGGYLLLYILRLPPYQHGRYLMPAMPIFMLFGLLGFLELQKADLLGRFARSARSAWRLGLALLTVGFVILGARAYGQDVGLIETEMVNTAKWAAVNLPPDAVIAAHDIGALGYFDQHRLIDMAGLVSPEVIPFLRDQVRMADFLNSQGANYLITFPSLYPDLTRTLPAIHVSGGRFAVAMGEQNMIVYCWRCH